MYPLSTAASGPPVASTLSTSRHASAIEAVHLRLDDRAAVEDVFVVEHVGLERQDLLRPQAPLLVPRARQAERLVPRRELHRARARLLR